MKTTVFPFFLKSLYYNFGSYLQMNSFRLAIAFLLMQLSFFGCVQAQEEQKMHALSTIAETHLGIGYEASKAIYTEVAKNMPSLPVGERNALIVRVLEKIGDAERGIMPGQLQTPRFEQIFVAATSRIAVVQMLKQMVRQEGDDYTSSFVLAVLNAERAWLQMILRNKLAPEDYLTLSRKINYDLLNLMLTDANFQKSYEALTGREVMKPRTVAYALFTLAVANTCTDNSRLCDRALPQ